MGGDKAAIGSYKISNLIPFNPVDKKTAATVLLPDGTTVRTEKGAPQVGLR
jgi:H+-transporting ATPase